MESNKNSTLTFEEPESFAFPYYTKYLGERIAFDETNQYFISTHNPYLLLAILEKTPKDQVNVFATYLEDYETKVKALAEEEISILMDSDPFFNLNRFIEEE
jgi:AAA15 family ATPase/GTPase